eukprot:11729688-Ditylum_brightwellii.AAC.1
MTNTNHNVPYQEYEPPAMQIPNHVKVKETTPPSRVEKTVPNIIHGDDNPQPHPPRVQQPQPHGPHVIPQCNLVQHEHTATIPPYYVNAVYNEETGKME